ncbi:type I-F CRISPR-associated protein Csy3 [Phaeovulum sp. NW3]|uniref:type I-F CRISPR-associated protein Csy3 n=1 Tax=Phaeovulum sp. NW3 TaxID=2934933 RepID=UPI0020216B25|nr:type I-F CRISPR-associated protein Csy3 [Phaeovulum sp. NW3]MCL7466255.1 type I-F CRISPR-associated protein Csy3 [Phaeovulum sp. NW3]
MAKSKPNDTVSFETGMLAYARSLQISEGVFFGVNGDRRIPVEVLEKGVRGQSSEDRAKNPGLSNPQTVEFAVLPQGCTAVALDFSIRVLPKTMAPHACGNPAVGKAYVDLAAEYARAGGFSVLAELYAWNIANARFAWRNRFQVDNAKVTVRFSGEKIAFNPAILSLDEVADRDEMAAALVEGDRAGLDRFIEGMTRGLTESPFAFEVTWMAEMDAGQEIFPSQEYIREEKAAKDLSRVYAKLPVFFGGREIGQASMHSQKIGAALRHIDIWHEDDEYGPIAVNPYGGVQETAAVLRKTKNNFYDIRRKAEDVLAAVRNAKTADDIPGSVHFMLANLVRGGVFGSSSKTAEANS